MGVYFEQRVFVPENVDWFEELWREEPELDFDLENEAALLLELGTEGVDLPSALDALFPIEWSRSVMLVDLEAEAQILSAARVPKALARLEKLFAKPRATSTAIVRQLEAGDEERARTEVVLAAKDADFQLGLDEGPPAVALALVHLAAGLRKAAQLEAPLLVACFAR